jgi:glyoxylase-like metal-dependent hydrolase (beta-lactamase superfamily II)
MTSGGTFLRQLATIGVSPQDVDYVVCTHMHADHVGWNTRLADGNWLPTFPKATYILGKEEWLWWKSRHESAPIDQIGDSVLPIVESRQTTLADGAHEVTEGVRLEPSPGHTPGHVCVRISSEGAQALITGDVIQHPVQCREPTWVPATDNDPDLALRTRREVLDSCSRDGTLVCVGHFPSPSFGHVRRLGNAYDFRYADSDV